MDLTQNVDALATGPSATVTVIGSSTQTLLPTATGSSAPISTSAGLSDFEKTIRTHGILMSVGFLVCLPLGILIAQFSRTISYLKTRWFTAHWFVQFIVSSPINLAGWVTGYHYVGESHFEDTHTRVGLALLVLYLAQMTLDVIIHFFKPKRESLSQPQSWNRGEAGMATLRPLAQPCRSSTSSNIDQTTPAPGASHVALAGQYDN
ncbi:hypothetical protein FRB90_004552 [Tulasnella sp. 427]|nr:hypothetical protein FRB90_004552 [Tulasnella sp. 427]